MSSAMFGDETRKARIRAWYDTFRDALQVPAAAREVETSFGRTHVLVAGPPDGPPLVCVHGALASSAHVLPELGHLVERYRVYAVDVVGQSVMSADRRLPVDDQSYGNWLGEVCDGLGLERFALMGVSWGGFVAMRLLQVAPDRVSALVLMVPAGMVAGSAWRGFVEVAWPMLRYRMSPSPERLKALLAPLFTDPGAQWGAYFGDAVRSYRMDMRVPPLLTPDMLAPYTGPALVFGAGEDLSFPGSALVARARELFPRAETVLLEGSRHCPPMDERFRATTADRIHAFLRGAGAAASQNAPAPGRDAEIS